MTLDANQILALAPDAASAKAGSQLAASRNWVTLGRSEQALWGECQGSGKHPYRTQVDLAGPAFKCSCPSRKFPCKHGLGLYLLLAAQPQLFAEGAAPDWVRDWQQSRQERQEKRAEKASAKPEPTPEAAAVSAAQARKREQKREEKVDAGLRELRTWLEDLAREGLSSVRARGQGFWDAIAARMVDAQAAPLARRLRRAGAMLYQTTLRDADVLVTNELAVLYLLTDAWQALDRLPEALQADVRSLLGFTSSQDEILRQPAVSDRWRVLAQSTTDEERLRVRATWLHGAASGRWALLLHYAAGSQGFEQPLATGTEFDAELCFYPGAHPLRALVRRQAAVQPLAYPSAAAHGLDALFDAYAEALARQPFLDRYPAMLEGVVPDAADHAALRDGQGRRIALDPAFRHPLHLLALSAGQPLTVFGEWDGRRLLPLSAWHEGRLFNVDTDFIA